jgi:hypothetical protein
MDERAALYACLEDWMDNAVGKGAFCGEALGLRV